MNSKKLWTLTLISLCYFFLANNVYPQCSTHSPTEYGKDLQADMIKSPPHRWYDPKMTFRVQSTARYWYGADIADAISQWNNSSYKGISTVFRFKDDGDTNAPSDYDDLNNVIGIKEMASHIPAQVHTWFYGNGEIS